MSDQAFEQFASLLPEPALLLRLDGQIEFANAPAREALGLLQRRPAEPPSLFSLAVADRAALEQYLRLCARSRDLLPGAIAWSASGEEPIEMRCEAGLLQQGSERSRPLLLFRFRPKRESIEQFTVLNEKIESLSREITRRKHVEADLERERERFRITLASIGDGVIATDPDERITFLNPAAQHLTGWPETEALGRPLSEVFNVVSETTGQPAERPTCQALHAGEIVALANHTALISRDGTIRSIADSAAPIRGLAGEILGSVMVFRDVSERRVFEQELQAVNTQLEQRIVERTRIAEQRSQQLQTLAAELTQAEQRRRRRLARALHDDLQQLLVAAKMHIGILNAGIRPAEVEIPEVDRLLGNAIQKSRELTLELSPPILYDRGLAPALEWLARWVEEKYGLRTQADIDDDAEPEEEPIRILLFEAVRELLFNVVKHARVDSARVAMQSVEPDRLEVAVHDAGIGFDVTEFDMLGGTTQGFGLSSLRQRLELLGGEVRVKSVPGEGTSVILRARRSPPESVAADVTPAFKQSDIAGGEPATSPAETNGRRVRILLVDDHQIVREGIAVLLGDYPDFEIVGQAVNGEDAVDLARLLRPDVVVMDVNMPRMNGIEATRHIKSEFPVMRVIGLSLHDPRDMASAMHQAGADDYLRKDGPADRLVASIRAAFD